MSERYSIIGYACGFGNYVPGAEYGPSAIRDRGLASKLEALGAVVTDLGDVTPNYTQGERENYIDLATSEEKLAKNLIPVYVACRELAERTNFALESDSIPIVLGGDHSFSIGSVAAVSNFYRRRSERIGLLWIDMHPDIHTPSSSTSKGIFGMSTAVLLGRVPGLLASLQDEPPAVNVSRIAYIGLRDIDPPERKVLRDLQIAAFTMKEIDKFGMAEVIRRALEVVCDDTAGFVASFDLDVCDAPLVPGVSLPSRGGLTFREVELLGELLYDSQKLLSFELVELNPMLDRDNMTADLAVSLIETISGKSIL